MEGSFVHESDREVDPAILNGVANPIHLLARDFFVLAPQSFMPLPNFLVDSSELPWGKRSHRRTTDPHDLGLFLSRH